MSKETLFLIFLLILPIALAQTQQEFKAGITPDSPLYVVDKTHDNFILGMKEGDDKTGYAIQVKDERVAEATVMVREQKQNAAQVSLEDANELSKIIEREVSPDLADLTKLNAQQTAEVLMKLKDEMPEEGWEGVEKLINKQLSQEERIKVATAIAEKMATYCDELAKTDFELMMKDEKCDPTNAPDWMKEYISEEIGKRQDTAKQMMIEMITTCIDDPRKCDCSKIPVKKEQLECEKNKALAIKCEFENDMSACDELDKQPVVPPDMPDFLKPIFETTIKEAIKKKESQMMEKFAPTECKEAGATTREACEEIMFSKYGKPTECEGMSNKECADLMRSKYPAGPPKMEDILKKTPRQCIEEGRPMPREKCEEMMKKLGEETCRNIKPEECMRKMFELTGVLPPECEGLTPEECGKQESRKHMQSPEMQELMKRIPKPCIDEEGFPMGPEECSQIMMRIGQEICQNTKRSECMKKMFEITGVLPPECEGKSAEQCVSEIQEQERIEEERMILEQPQPPEGMPPSGVEAPINPEEIRDIVDAIQQTSEQGPSSETHVLITNPETGETEFVKKDEIIKIAEEASEKAQEEIAPPPEVQQIRQEIEQLEQQKEQIPEEITVPIPVESAQPAPEVAPPAEIAPTPPVESSPSTETLPTGQFIYILNKLSKFLPF